MPMPESATEKPWGFQAVPPIGVLREIVSKKKWEQPWHRLLRKVSIYMTWFLLHLPISANGVTLLFLSTGVLAGVIFVLGTPAAWIAGTLCLWLSIVLDFSDGEVARYHHESSWFGEYFEETVHGLVSMAMYIGISVGVWRQAPGSPWPFLFALLALGSSLLIRNDGNLLMKAQLHYFGANRLPEPASEARAGQYSPTAYLSPGMSVVGMVIFDLGIYFLALPVLALLDRMDLFLMFYGITRSLAAVYLIVQTWKRRNQVRVSKEG